MSNPSKRAPEDCGDCRAVFDNDPALQAELLHEAIKYGTSAARSMLNERLSDQHDQHFPVELTAQYLENQGDEL